MADIAIDSNVDGTQSQPSGPRTMAFKGQTGYAFYVSLSSPQLYYRKTTDGGSSWGSAVSFAGVGDTVGIFSIWADWWTSGNTGTKIHVWYVEDATNLLRYCSLDTASDTIGSEVTVYSNASITLYGKLSGTVSRGGKLHVVFAQAAASAYVHYVSTSGGSSWTSKATPWESTEDHVNLLPGSLTDADDVWCLFWDFSANAITLKTYDYSGDSWSESSTIFTAVATDPNVNANNNMSASIRWSDGHIIMVVHKWYDSASDEFACFDITDGSTWTQKTNVADINDNICGSISIDQNNDDLYVFYLGNDAGGETAGSANNAYYKKSTDGGATWSTEVAYGEGVDDDNRAIWSDHGSTTFMVSACWYDDDNTDLWYNYPNAIYIEEAVNVTVTPGVLALTTARFAPKVNLAVKPGLATLSSASFAPKLISTFKPSVASLSSSLLAPAARVTIRPVPGVASLSLSPLAPTTFLLTRAVPDAAALALAGQAPEVIAGTYVTPDTAALTLGLQSPTVAHIAPGPASLSLSPLAPDAAIEFRFTPGVAALALSGLAPSITFVDRFTPSPASLGISGLAPTTYLHIRALPGAGSLSLSGLAPLAIIGLRVTPGAAGLVLTGLSPRVILTVYQWLGRILAEVYDTAGNLLDDGPFADVISGEYTQELDRIGSFALTVPADHERASIFQQRYEVRLYREGEGLVFKGIIGRANIDATAESPVLVVQGSSIARRLVFKSTGRGRAYTAETLAAVVADLLSGTGLAAGTVDTLSYALTGRADSATRWAALEGFAKQARVHLREDVLDEEIDVSELGADSGITLLNVEAVSSEALASNSSVIAVAGVKVDESSEDLWNRLYPLGAGEGNNALDLGPSDRTSPYTIQSEVGPDGRTQYYIEDAASVAAYGLSERWVNVKEAIPLSNDAGAFTAAANALYDVAAGALQVLSEPRTEYAVKVPGLRHLEADGSYRFEVGDKMRLFYRGLAHRSDGAAVWLDVNALLWVMGYTRRFRADGGDDWELKVANLDRQNRDIGDRIAEIQADVRALSVSPKPYNYERSSGPYRDSVNASYPLDFNVRWDDGTFMLHRSELTFRVKGVRANATGAASGGTTVPTTSSGGGGTSSADTSHTHSVSGQTAASSGAHRHTMFLSGSDATSSSIYSQNANATHNHSSATTDGADGLVGVHAHTVSGGTSTENASHQHQIGSDAMIARNASTLAELRFYVFGVNPDSLQFATYDAATDHTHTVSATTSGGGSSHTHTLAAHTHTVTIPNHTHTLSYGIYQEATPGSPSIGVVINGTDRTSALGGPWNTGQTLDITPYLTTGGLGQPLRQDNTVRLTAAVLCDIEVEVHSMATSTSIALPV